MLRTNYLTRFISWLFIFLTTAGCTRTCVGAPELGSKRAPLKIGLARGPGGLEAAKMDRLEACFEEASGYRIQFRRVPDDRSLLSQLHAGQIQYGVVSALALIQAQERYGVKPAFVAAQRGAIATRSVVLGKASVWRRLLQEQGLPFSSASLRRETSLSALNEGRFAYTTPDSDLGFLVPRFLLLQRHAFPREAVFTGSPELTLQALRQELVLAGAVPELLLQEQFPGTGALQVAAEVGGFVALAVSQPLPTFVLAVREDFPERQLQTFSGALAECARGEFADAFKQAFGGDLLLPAAKRMFSYAQDLVEFDRQFARILVPFEE